MLTAERTQRHQRHQRIQRIQRIQRQQRITIPSGRGSHWAMKTQYRVCRMRMGFPNLPQMVWLASLWLRPDPFRHLPGGSTPLVGTRLRFTTARRACVVAQNRWVDSPRFKVQSRGGFAESIAVLGCVHLCSVYGEKSFWLRNSPPSSDFSAARSAEWTLWPVDGGEDCTKVTIIPLISLRKIVTGWTGSSRTY